MEPQGVAVKAQSVRSVKANNPSAGMGENRSLYAIIAYYFPQYKLNDIQQLPYRDVLLLTKTAQRIEAEKMYNLTLIASAPHSKNGKGVKELLKHFKEIMDSNG